MVRGKTWRRRDSLQDWNSTWSSWEAKMKVFISWSGNDSRQAAELLKRWLPNVIQEVEAWLSTHDIGKGEKWFSNLSETLSKIEFGVLVVTKTNYKAPWIIYEAGALSKTVQSRVIPILCDMNILHIANTPLSQFNCALANKHEFWAVIAAINAKCQRQDPLKNFAFRRRLKNGGQISKRNTKNSI